MGPQEKALGLIGQIIAHLNVLTFFKRSIISILWDTICSPTLYDLKNQLF